jgi:hypothetical protein
MSKRGRRKSKRYEQLDYSDTVEQLPKSLTDEPVGFSHYNQGHASEITVQLEIRTFPICWGIPMDEVLYSKFLPNLMRLNPMPWDYWATTESTYLPSARNEIHDQFLKMEGCNYLMMLDSDVLPPPGLVTRLLSHRKDIVGGWYKNKHLGSGHHPIVYDWAKEDDGGYWFRHREGPGQGLEKVAGMGAGCWLMSRHAAETLGPSPYSMHKATEDLNLSKRIMDSGLEMWVDWEMACAHMGVSWV